MAVFKKEPERAREARADLKAHNERNPHARIVITPIQIQTRVKNLRREGMAATLQGVAKECRAEACRFLNQEN